MPPACSNSSPTCYKPLAQAGTSGLSSSLLITKTFTKRRSLRSAGETTNQPLNHPAMDETAELVNVSVASGVAVCSPQIRKEVTIETSSLGTRKWSLAKLETCPNRCRGVTGDHRVSNDGKWSDQPISFWVTGPPHHGVSLFGAKLNVGKPIRFGRRFN